MGGGELEFENFCAKGLAAGPERLALVVGQRRLTYAELGEEIDRAARALAVNGVSSGDRVGIYFQNCVEQLALYFACFRLGAIGVPVNPEYQRAEVVHALGHCGARLLVRHRQMAAETTGLELELPRLTRTVVLDRDEDPWQCLASAAGGEPRSKEAGARFPAEPQQPAMIYYTSGSTSAPKGVTHTSVRSMRTLTVAQRLKLWISVTLPWLVRASPTLERRQEHSFPPFTQAALRLFSNASILRSTLRQFVMNARREPSSFRRCFSTC